nr:hypothetical protein [Rhizobium sp. FKY42]
MAALARTVLFRRLRTLLIRPHGDGLLGLVQGGTLEIHPWGSSVSDWERPDMVIIDLNPGEGTDWQAVMAAAGEVRSRH